MLFSDPATIIFRGAPARLYVVRNDGYCWGRIVVGDQEYDVNTAVDLYEQIDEDALIALEEASNDPANVSEAVGWHEGDIEKNQGYV